MNTNITDFTRVRIPSYVHLYLTGATDLDDGAGSSLWHTVFVRYRNETRNVDTETVCHKMSRQILWLNSVVMHATHATHTARAAASTWLMLLPRPAHIHNP